MQKIQAPGGTRHGVHGTAPKRPFVLLVGVRSTDGLSRSTLEVPRLHAQLARAHDTSAIKLPRHRYRSTGTGVLDT